MIELKKIKKCAYKRKKMKIKKKRYQYIDHEMVIPWLRVSLDEDASKYSHASKSGYHEK